jgi:uncharacterized protein (DUF1800 family)
MMPFKALLALLTLAAPVLQAQVTVTITAATNQLHIGTALQFTATVTGSTDQGVNWTVNSVAGGNSTLGAINAQGLYTTPGAMPSPNIVSIVATHRATGTESRVFDLRFSNPFPVLASVRPAHLSTGLFGITLNGNGFVPGSRVRLGDTFLNTVYVSPTRLVATGTVTSADKGDVSLLVFNPEPGGTPSAPVKMTLNQPRDFTPQVTAAAAARFLEQASFGPDRASIDQVQRLGFEAWIDRQFDEPVTPYQDPEMLAFNNVSPLQTRFFTNAVHGSDQLRQRVTFALGQIWVISASLANAPERYIPYLRILQTRAFGNYRDLMLDMTLSPTMGDWLNMVNNVKADTARGIRPNENYARELLQLFTIGTVMLTSGGTAQLDKGQPVQSYTQTHIQEFSRALTGWTYPTRPGSKLAARNSAYYVGPMEAWDANHDTGSKNLLVGVQSTAGQNAAKDLDVVLDNLFYHPNIAPFVCKNLIQHLVKSNPSPDYVARIVTVFDGPTGGTQRGDLKRVVKAILLDPEARAGDDTLQPAATEGHLREPVLWMVALLRALGAMVNDTNSLASRGAALGQNIHYPPTVFNYYMPGTKAAASDLLGPEFEILTPTAAVERANQVNTIIYGSLGNGAVVDLNNWAALANSPSELLDEIDLIFFHGNMPLEMRQILMDAVVNTATERAKAQAALYLAASSAYYTVQR